MKKLILLAAALLSVALGAQAALANDSEAETSLGGLTLKQSEHISMDSEDLYISAKQVRVKYRFKSRSGDKITSISNKKFGKAREPSRYLFSPDIFVILMPRSCISPILTLGREA